MITHLAPRSLHQGLVLTVTVFVKPTALTLRWSTSSKIESRSCIRCVRPGGLTIDQQRRVAPPCVAQLPMLASTRRAR